MEEWLGLQAAKRMLRGVFASDSAIHAVLFFGEPGAGKTLAAETLSRYWSCLEPVASGACGTCPACVAFDKGILPDRLDVHPRGSSSWIHLAAIQETSPRPEEYADVTPSQTFLRTPPIRARNKVVCIRDAERLNLEASNSLLKLLEEPPAHARFVLCTSEVSQVRATIRSRCLLVPCELPGHEEWAAAFAPLEEWEEALSRRSPGRLARIRQNPKLFQSLFELGRDTMTAQRESGLALADRFRKIAEEFGKVEGVQVRRATTETLEFLGAALFRFRATSEALARVATSRKRIAGNVGAGPEIDALFIALAGANRAERSSRSAV